jgi:uncharacterized membrane protein YuzA (DUF378 family)
MIRWKDCIFAVLAAELIRTFLLTGMFSAIWYMNIIGISTVWFIYDLWLDYCKFRARQERSNKY